MGGPARHRGGGLISRAPRSERGKGEGEAGGPAHLGPRRGEGSRPAWAEGKGGEKEMGYGPRGER